MNIAPLNVAPLLAAPPVIQLHVAAAVVALASGLCVLATRKGTRFHVTLGRVFAATMVFVAASSFWITSLRPGHFSPIHILSVVTLVTIPIAIWSRRRGDIRGHAIGMSANFIGLIVAGVFTLAPGRIINAIVFGAP